MDLPFALEGFFFEKVNGSTGQRVTFTFHYIIYEPASCHTAAKVPFAFLLLQESIRRLLLHCISTGNCLVSFNADKCNSIIITRKKNKIQHSYSLHNQNLEQVKYTRYLGVDLASDLSWKNHIERTCSKANRQLAFLSRNLQIQNTRVNETAYKGLVRPLTKYCCTVWDPNYKKYKKQLESVQRKAARFVHNRYERQTPVNEMVNNLGWDPLELQHL